MKLSKSDLLLLNNFASINESIHFYEGALQSTVANSRNHFAFATFEEEFPKESIKPRIGREKLIIFEKVWILYAGNC